MKGIKKLFFGLILMTLIGVGFKVDAKAAAEMSLEIKPPSNWGATDADFVVTLLDIDNAFFPDEDGAFILTAYNHPSLSSDYCRHVIGEAPEMPENIKASLVPFQLNRPLVSGADELRKIIDGFFSL